MKHTYERGNTMTCFNRNGMATLERFAKLAVASATVIALSGALGLATTAYGKETEIKFTNNSGQKADDLHVEFQRGSLEVTGMTPKDALPLNDASDSRSTVNFRAGLSGKGVAVGDSVVIKFKYSGSDPKVKCAWWTNGNTLTPTGNHKKGTQGTGDYIPDGELNLKTDLTLAWAGSRGAGDGVYMVMIDSQPRDFITFPGDTPDSVSARFATFIQEWQYGLVLAEEPGFVQCTGLSYFTDIPNIQIDVLQQDSQLELFIDDCNMQLDVFNLVAGERAQFTVTDHHEGQVVAIVYSLKPGYTGINGTFGYCGSLGLKGVNVGSLIGQGPIVGGEFTKMLPIPPNVAGLELQVQGILRDTCPGSCESNVVTQVIE